MEVSCFKKFEIGSILSSWRRFENFPILCTTTSKGLIRFLPATIEMENRQKVDSKITHRNLFLYLAVLLLENLFCPLTRNGSFQFEFSNLCRPLNSDGIWKIPENTPP